MAPEGAKALPGALQEKLAAVGKQRGDEGCGNADDDPVFLPQERLEQSSDDPNQWQRVGVPQGGEQRSDIFEERLRRAAELKVEATAKLKAGDFGAAKQLYRRAYHHADYNDLERMQFAPKHEKMIDDTQLPILLNLAQATLKLSEQQSVGRKGPPRPDKQLRACVTYCSEVLKRNKRLGEPANIKALYRRGLARERSGDPEEAVPDLRQARSTLLQLQQQAGAASASVADAGSGAADMELKAVTKALRRVTEQAKAERKARAHVWAGKLPPTTDSAVNPGSSSSSRRSGGVAAPAASAAPDWRAKLPATGTLPLQKSTNQHAAAAPSVGGGSEDKPAAAAAATGTVQLPSSAADLELAPSASSAAVVRPPLSTKGVWHERAQQLRLDLLQRMGHPATRSPTTDDDSPLQQGNTGSDDASEAEGKLPPSVAKVSSARGFQAFNKHKSGRMTWRELAIGLDALKVNVADLENPYRGYQQKQQAVRQKQLERQHQQKQQQRKKQRKSGGGNSAALEASATEQAEEEAAEASDSAITVHVSDTDSLNWRRLLDRLDVDRDGRVTLADFRAFLGLADAHEDADTVAAAGGARGDSADDGAGSSDDDSRDAEEASGGGGREKAIGSVLRKLILPVYLPACLAAAAQALAYPVVAPLALRLAGGGQQGQAGLALGVKAAVALLAQFPSARLLPLLGVRYTSTAGIALEALAGLVMGLAARSASFRLFQCAEVLNGCGMALWTVGRQSALLELTPAYARGRITAIYGGSIRCAVALCPAVGGLLSADMARAPGRVFFVQFCVTMLGALSCLFGIPVGAATTTATTTSQRQQQQQQQQRKKQKPVRVLATLRKTFKVFAQAGLPIMALTLMRSARNIVVPLAGAHIGMSVPEIGAAMALGTTIEAPMFLPAGWGYDRFGRKPVVVPSLTVLALAWLLLSRATSRKAIMVASGMLGVANGLLSGINTLTSQDFAPSGARDAAHVPNFFALWNIQMQLGAVASPVLIGGLLARQRGGSVGSVSVASAAIAAVTVLAAWWFALITPEKMRPHHSSGGSSSRRRRRRHKDQEEEPE